MRGCPICSRRFRVAVVTDLLKQDVPLEDVQYLAGHSNPKTTQIYDRRRRHRGNSGNLPNPSPVVNELRCVVRMEQTNFQFANTWEHGRTREVMIAGFRTLGEAVNNLGSTIESSLVGLQQSISSDVAGLVQEEIKTRDSLDRRLMEQNRMLDNIQHHRKPGITGSPSRY